MAYLTIKVVGPSFLEWVFTLAFAIAGHVTSLSSPSRGSTLRWMASVSMPRPPS